MSALEKTIASLAQTVTNLTVQVGQMATEMNQRENGTFPSQPLANPNTVAHSGGQGTSPPQSTHINAVQTLRSGRKLDNQVKMPDLSISSSSSSVPSVSPRQEKGKEKEQDDLIVESPYEPKAPFPSRLTKGKNPA